MPERRAGTDHVTYGDGFSSGSARAEGRCSQGGTEGGAPAKPVVLDAPEPARICVATGVRWDQHSSWQHSSCAGVASAWGLVSWNQLGRSPGSQGRHFHLDCLVEPRDHWEHFAVAMPASSVGSRCGSRAVRKAACYWSVPIISKRAPTSCGHRTPWERATLSPQLMWMARACAGHNFSSTRSNSGSEVMRGHSACG